MSSKNNRFVPAYRDGKFQCSVHEAQESLFQFAYRTTSMLIKSSFARLMPRNKENIDWYAPTNPIKRSHKLLITWIGHSTLLIQVGGMNILTDPIFGNSSLLYPRIMEPGIRLENLPPIDCVLISHNHLDHMEGPSLKVLSRQKNIKFLVPFGDKAWFDKRSIGNAQQFLWWDSYMLKSPEKDCIVKFTFLPAVHWTQRWITDKNCSLWGSWMIECNDKTIYFGGDTAYGQHFRLIAEEFPHIDVAALPVGPCEPREWMRYSHMDADEAAQAFVALKARHFIPIHWGTFHFGNETAYLPIERLKKWWNCHEKKQSIILHEIKAGTFIEL